MKIYRDVQLSLSKAIHSAERSLNLAETQSNESFSQETHHRVSKKLLELRTFTSVPKADDYESMIKKMRDSYNEKSLIQMKYFLFNVSQKKSKNKPLIDFKEDTHSFMNYRKNFEFYNRSHLVEHGKQVTGKDTKDNIGINLKSELIRGDFLRQQDTKYGFKKMAKVYYLEELNKGNTPYFITFTLPSAFQKYKLKKGIAKEERHYEDFSQLVKNKNYSGMNFEENIEKALIRINEVHTYFYHRVKKKIQTSIISEARAKAKSIINRIKKTQKIDKSTLKMKRLSLIEKYKTKLQENMDFIKIIESSKNLTPHAHILLWSSSKYETQIKEAYEETIKEFSLKKKSQDFETIKEEEAHVSTYLTKYLQKSNDSEGDDFNFYNYYKRMFGAKHKLFTTSNFRDTTQKKIDIMYKYFKEHKPYMIERLKESGKSLYHWLEQMELKSIFKFETEDKIVHSIDIKKIENYFLELFDINKVRKEAVEHLNNEKGESYDYKDKPFWIYGLQEDVNHYECFDNRSEYIKYFIEIKRSEAYQKTLEHFLENTKDYLIQRQEKVITYASVKETYNFEVDDYINIYHEHQYDDTKIGLEHFMSIVSSSPNVSFNNYANHQNYYKNEELKYAS